MSETRVTMRTRVQRYVGSAIDTTINQGILDGCNRLQHKHDWRFQETSTTISVSEGDSTFSLPADYKRDANPYMGDTDTGYRRAKKILRNGVESYDADDEGRPLAFRIWNGVGNFHKSADDDYSFLYEYFKLFSDLNSDDAPSDSDFQDFLDECHEAIEAFAIARGFERLKRYQDAKYWQNETQGQPLGRFEEIMLILIERDREINESGIDLIMETPG